MSRRIWGIRGFRSDKMSLPLTIDWPNLSPSPSSACAVAVRVSLSLIGSICSEIAVMVSNSVLNSVVTPLARIGVAGFNRADDGLSGATNEMYLLPNTVVAFSSAVTFSGISLRYLGLMSSVSWAC
ncbi:Uncharacterised protein [Mycolicibacterium fortuitum]|uniref:Uncharacterized protein n=1 Tax=Mycolicibacterium fortuitum TaxID=1766 RepID=A0A378UY69_MYCFO|nr:Uncharacterised protein [Mycolicibacterium fortuitum]